MKMLTFQTIQLIHSFASGVQERHAQNVLLHNIFSRVVMVDHVEQEPKLFVQACMTLARLYWDQSWGPAGVFFFMLTGFLLADDETVILSPVAFPKLSSPVELDPKTINGICDLHCDVFNALWIEQEEDSDEEESEEEESEEEESGEDDESGKSD